MARRRPGRPKRAPHPEWEPRLAGLERPRQWLGFFVGFVVVLLAMAVFAWLSFG